MDIKLMTKEEIMDILQKEYDYVNTLYPQDRLLGIFTYGKTSQGFISKGERLQTIVCYLPTFEELCSAKAKIEDVSFGDDQMIEVRDLRILLKNLIFQEPTGIECLCSDYKILSKKYEKVFNETFIKHIEEIFHFDEKALVRNLYKGILAEMSLYNDTLDPEHLFEVCRLRIIGTLYLENNNCFNCINLKKDYHINYLMEIKQGRTIPNLENIKKEIDELYEESEKKKVDVVDDGIIKYCATELMKLASLSTVEKKDFLKTLTDMERKGLKIILRNLEDNGVGVISISKMVEEYHISRPVFKNVLQKMKDNKVAEINNMGVKGTYIKLIDDSYLDLL